MSEVSTKLVKLPAHFSQVQLSGLKEIVDQHLDDGHHVQLDVSEIDRIDGAAVQFLLAMSKFQDADSKPETVIGTQNDVLSSALEDTGVKGLRMLTLRENGSAPSVE